MNYYQLFRVRSWNNDVRCMSFCILKQHGSYLFIQVFCATIISITNLLFSAYPGSFAKSQREFELRTSKSNKSEKTDACKALMKQGIVMSQWKRTSRLWVYLVSKPQLVSTKCAIHGQDTTVVSVPLTRRDSVTNTPDGIHTATRVMDVFTSLDAPRVVSLYTAPGTSLDTPLDAPPDSSQNTSLDALPDTSLDSTLGTPLGTSPQYWTLDTSVYSLLDTTGPSKST